MNSLRSELLKIKGTSVICLVLIAAFIIPFVMVYDHDFPDPNQTASAWDYFYKDGLKVFVFAFLPLFCVLASTLLIQIEVRNNTWKQVLASPQSFFNILLAKFAVLQLLIIAFMVTYNVYAMLGAALLDAMYGDHVLTYLDHWPELLKINAMAYGSILGISALSFWLALCSKNFIAPIAIGLLLWFAAPAALENGWTHVDTYVFAIPITTVLDRYQSAPLFHQLLSFGYAIVFFAIALIQFTWQRR